MKNMKIFYILPNLLRCRIRDKRRCNTVDIGGILQTQEQESKPQRHSWIGQVYMYAHGKLEDTGELRACVLYQSGSCPPPGIVPVQRCEPSNATLSHFSWVARDLDFHVKISFSICDFERSWQIQLFLE